MGNPHWRARNSPPERDKASVAVLEGKKYTHILAPEFRWSTWAAPKDKVDRIDHNKALTCDDLRDFVNGKLFPYLASLYPQKLAALAALKKPLPHQAFSGEL